MKNKKGFTLIELIVSITIIAVLTAVGMVSFTGASKRARDSRRMADLEKIRIALETYKQGVGSSYPSTLIDLVPSYTQTLPTDPKTNTNYQYGHSGYTYYLCAYVENLGSTTVDVANCSGLPTGYAGYYKTVNP